MPRHDTLIIDDRTGGDRTAASGGEWRLITDGVMGGVSRGRLMVDSVDGRDCLRLTGAVSLDNNGGFIQAALDLAPQVVKHARHYRGLAITVRGNDEPYNIHLRTRDNRLPWQSYRAGFTAPPEWVVRHLPFTEFAPHRTDTALDLTALRRIGIVAIGREFRADLCIAAVELYR